MHSNRPSYREVDKKIKVAKSALIRQNGLYANINKAVGELNELQIENSNQVWKLILDLLDEISPEDYVGSRPPKESYEKTIENQELFAFCWNSKKLRKRCILNLL